MQAIIGWPLVYNNCEVGVDFDLLMNHYRTNIKPRINRLSRDDQAVIGNVINKTASIIINKYNIKNPESDEIIAHLMLIQPKERLKMAATMMRRNAHCDNQNLGLGLLGLVLLALNKRDESLVEILPLFAKVSSLGGFVSPDVHKYEVLA